MRRRSGLPGDQRARPGVIQNRLRIAKNGRRAAPARSSKVCCQAGAGKASAARGLQSVTHVWPWRCLSRTRPLSLVPGSCKGAARVERCLGEEHVEEVRCVRCCSCCDVGKRIHRRWLGHRGRERLLCAGRAARLVCVVVRRGRSVFISCVPPPFWDAANPGLGTALCQQPSTRQAVRRFSGGARKSCVDHGLRSSRGAFLAVARAPSMRIFPGTE